MYGGVCGLIVLCWVVCGLAIWRIFGDFTPIRTAEFGVRQSLSVVSASERVGLFFASTTIEFVRCKYLFQLKLLFDKAANCCDI